MVKKKIIRIAFFSLAACATAAAAGLFCFGPLIPRAVEDYTLRAKCRAAQSLGKRDAARALAAGRMSYRFDRYLVEGLPEYAREIDGIAAYPIPSDMEQPIYYFEGFNSVMATALRQKHGAGFPEGYVRHYLEKGWLDLAKAEPGTCPVHHVAMEVRTIPFEIDWPFTFRPPDSKTMWRTASEQGFPFPGTTRKVDQSLLPRPRNARGHVCAACTEAEKEWLAARKEAR
jgi:hypothetical protein